MSKIDVYTDKELFSLIARDDHRAYKILMNRYRNNLFGQAMAYLKDTFSAQDIVQEVFLVIWTNRKELPAVKNPENYLFIVARNKIVKAFRKKLFLSLPGNIELVYPSGPFLADRQFESRQMMTMIQYAVDQMPPQRRLVFELGKKDGLKYEQISKQLGISRNTVKAHMVQALSFIRCFIRSQAVLLLFF